MYPASKQHSNTQVVHTCKLSWEFLATQGTEIGGDIWLTESHGRCYSTRFLPQMINVKELRALIIGLEHLERWRREFYRKKSDNY